jgi:uncharacterized protein DUF5678
MCEDHFEDELELNRRAYAHLRDQIRRDHAGKYVAMAFGKIVAVGDDYDAVTAEVNALAPPPGCSLVFPAELEPLFDPPYRDTYSEFVD